jgi:hypothetical protein
MKQSIIFIFMIICVGAMVAAGCTNAGSRNVTPQTPTALAPTPPVVHATVTATPTATAAVPLTTIPVTVQPASTIDFSNYAPAPDAPIVVTSFQPYLYLASNGLWAYFEIPDCYMRLLLPDVVNAPDYGITPAHPNITSISSGRFQVILNEWNEEENQNPPVTGADHCRDVPPAPYWTFIEVSSLITPRNFKPVNYEIVVIYQAFGKNAGIYITNQTLSTNNPQVRIVSYIPVRSDQAGYISNIPVQFYKLSG